MSNLPVIRKTLMSPNVKKMIENRIGEKAGAFTTSMLDLIGENYQLQQCDPNLVIQEALKAAALDLPISKALGFAYVIPYKKVPQFQMGYKGYIQLAVRTGQYRHLNSGVIYEGQEVVEDFLKGTLVISGKKKSEKVVGFFAYMELLNGFEKAIYWTLKEVTAHAKKFSAGFKSKKISPWDTDFNEMAKKTMILRLVPKYGPMSIEMSQAVTYDRPSEKVVDPIESDAEENANQQLIDIEPVEEKKPASTEISDEEKKEIVENEAKQEAPY